MDAVMGVDLGSTTCKAVILSERGEIIGRGITSTGTNHHLAAETASQGAEASARSRFSEKTGGPGPGETAREEIRIRSRIGTGYGRHLLPFPPERIVSEIMCHARGAHHLFPGTRTVLDIGGQDTKAIQVDAAGIVTSFQMNDRCAAGCGRYLAYVADELELGIAELGPMACRACRFVPVTSTCTVFAGAELRTLLHAGEEKEDVLMGLHRAVVLRALSLLARSGGISDQFTFTGGVANNEAVALVLKEIVVRSYPQVQINIHHDSIYMGAIGAALYALEDGC